MTKGTRSSDPESTGSRSLSNTSAARVTQVWLLSGVNDDVALDVTRGGKPARSAKSYQIGDTAGTLKTRAMQRTYTALPVLHRAACGLLCV